MTMIPSDELEGGGRTFIFDRDQGKFVSVRSASADQMRRFGQAQYRSLGRGRNRRMVPINARGEATSYSVAESTRRGELVPAGRAAGREGLAERRSAERQPVRVPESPKRGLPLFAAGDAEGEGRLFIFDRDEGKFVGTDVASQDQMRRFGDSLYYSVGSGSNRVMTTFNPRGEPTSYAVAESSRRGELVPAPRSEGRAISQELNQSRAARLERNRQLLNIDYNNQTDWLMMTESVRRLVVSDPTVLEGQAVNIDFEAVLDYAMYGTPRSPGVFMGGVSNSFIFDESLGRYVNITFASDEQMRQYSDTMYYRTSRGQMVTVQDNKPGPQVDTEMPEEPRPVRSVTDIEGFPVEAMIGDAADVSIVGPWLEQNAKNFSTEELNIVDRFLRDQANIDVYRVREPGVETPWAGAIRAVRQTREDAREQKQREDRERRRQETIEREGIVLMTPEQEMQAQMESDEGRRLARREEQRRQMFADIAAKLKPESRWMEMQYNAVPLGFSEQEFARADAAAAAQLRFNQATQALEDAKTSNPDAVPQLKAVVDLLETEFMAARQQDAGFTFREGVFIPYSARDRLDASLAQEYEQRALGRTAENVNAVFSQRVRNLAINEQRLQPGTDFRPQDLLTEGQAMSMLRSIASTPSEMIKLKTQLAFVYGREEQYTSDTAVDSGTVNNFIELVTESNNAGMKPLEYLKMALNDPSVVERSNERARKRGGGGGFTIRVPAVDDVATVFQDVARRRVGMQLDQEQVKQMAQTYVQQYESQLRGQMGRDVIKEPMSADTFAEQQISQQFGGEETVFQTGLQLDTLIEMIGGTR
jgi:hypothetical protein